MNLPISGILLKGNAFLVLQIHGGRTTHSPVSDAQLGSWLSTKPVSALHQLPILTPIADVSAAIGPNGGMKTVKLANPALATKSLTKIKKNVFALKAVPLLMRREIAWNAPLPESGIRLAFNVLLALLDSPTILMLRLASALLISPT